MNYGIAAYTKVLELEKRVLSSKNDNLVKIYDSGEKSTFSFSQTKKFKLDNFLSEKMLKIYYRITMDICSIVSDNIKVGFFINSTLIEEKFIELDGVNNKTLNLDFTFVPSNNGVLESYLLFECETMDNIITVTSLRVIALNTSSNKSQAEISGVELRHTKTLNNTYIISYTGEDNVVYATEVGKDNLSLDFIAILNAISHSFAFDKKGNLHLYYIDENNNLYDKTVGSNYNDILLASNCLSVYAITSASGTSSEIVVCFISNDGSASYLTIEENGYSEILKVPAPDNIYKDLCMVASNNFVYLVLTTKDNINFILKSSYEPLSAATFENIEANASMIASKYYTLGEYAQGLLDTITAGAVMTASIMWDYEGIIEKRGNQTINAAMSISSSVYEIAKEEPVIYTVVIDKAERKYTDRCVYADDAEGFTAASNTNSVFSYNGWNERFPFNKIKPCAIKAGQILGYLDPNDYSRFEDGSSVPSDEYVDIMVEFPKIYYSIENIDPYIYVHVSNTKINDNYKCYAHVYDGQELDKIYIAAYHSCYKSYNGKNTMFSQSGVLPNCSDVVTNLEYETLLKNKEDGYRMLNFDQTVLFQCLFIILFKSTGSQFVFGKGNHDTDPVANGYCDTLGMNYASLSSAVTPCKLFGIENIFGNCYTRVEGITIHAMNDYDTYTLYRRNPYSNVEINKAGEGYDMYTNPDLDGLYYENFFFNDPYGTTELGFLPRSYRYGTTASSYSRFYTDTSFICSSYGLWYGGDGYAYSHGGIFHYMRDDGNELLAYYNPGYRLVYYPIGGN